ncbi:MAG: hypothetical protein K2O32_04150 [Acetatifactor sp.]|nr:hypothetical protein [Acetatifactor sp.]
MNTTPHYGLGKPLSTEKYSVSVQNNNMDLMDSALNELASNSNNQEEILDEHIKNKNNPHNVTKEQVGLGNVDNTSDINKPVSTAQQSAINSAISNHNASTSTHTDIRNLISKLTARLNTLADSDDTTLDQLSEIVDYIKNNKSLIDGITTSKVNVSDIIDNLTSADTNKPLSAKQGKVLKDLIDALTNTIPTVNNGILTIQKNGTNIQTFAANQSTNVTANITVPTKTSELTNDSGFVTTGSITTSVSGVKGNAETTYRTGNVNITATDVGALPIEGGTITGNLRLQFNDTDDDDDAHLYGNKINFGDGDYVHLYEYEDDCLEIKANHLRLEINDNLEISTPIDGNITGNAATATNADTVDGKHASDFLPISGGTITGNLRLKGAGNYGNKLNFGDGEYVFLHEYEDDKLEIKASTLKLTSNNNIIVNQPIAGSITGNAGTATYANNVRTGTDIRNALNVRGFASGSNTNQGAIFLQEDLANAIVNVGIDGLGAVGVNLAKNAYNDSAGNSIINTYAKKTDISALTNAVRLVGTYFIDAWDAKQTVKLLERYYIGHDYIVSSAGGSSNATDIGNFDSWYVTYVTDRRDTQCFRKMVMASYGNARGALQEDVVPLTMVVNKGSYLKIAVYELPIDI